MVRFRALFQLGVKGFFNWKNIVLLVVLGVAAMYGVHKGALECKSMTNECNEFKNNEKYKFVTVLNYINYSNQGIQIFYFPPSSGLFYSNAASIDESYGTIDSITMLNIDSNCKNRQIFNNNGSFQFRFSVIVMVLMSLIMLLQGYWVFKNLGYLKVLAGNWSPFKVFMTIMVTRVVLSVLFFLLIFGIGLVLLQVENIGLSLTGNTGLDIYLVTTSLALIFFLVMGSIVGQIRTRISRAAILLAVWILFIFIWPALVNSIIEEKASAIPPSVIGDNLKLKTVNDFEQLYGGFKNYTLEEARKIVEGYYNDIFPKVEAEDIRQKEKIAEVIEVYRDISVLVPTSFYTMTCQELSGRGYGSYLEMYDYLLKIRREFVRFWIDRVYYNDPKVMVNFIKADENVFRSRGLVPPNRWKGILLTLSYIILLGFFSYLLFKRSLYHMNKKEIAKLGALDVETGAGEFYVKLIKGNLLNKALYPVLSGKGRRLAKKGLQGLVKIDGKNLLEGKPGLDFVYLCRPQDLPEDLKVKHWLEFHCRWNRKTRTETKTILQDPSLKEIVNKYIYQLEDKEAFELSLKLMEVSRGKVYFINDLTGDLVISEIVPLINLVERLNREGALVIYLTRPYLMETKLIRDGSYFAEGKWWRYTMMSVQGEERLKETGGSDKTAGKKEP